jgi:acyl-CoA dehydrogenase
MLDSDVDDIVETVRTFVRKEVVPLEDEVEEQDGLPTRIADAAKAVGLYGYTIPEEFGGLGLDPVQESRVTVELAWTTPALGALVSTNNGLAGQVLLIGGTDEQKREWLPRLATGSATASFGLTEPGAGSDPSTLATSARRDGSDWILNGGKCYITNAPVADLFMIFARTDPDAPGNKGITAFLVPASTPGLSTGPKDRKMGNAGAHTSDVHLDDVRVPADAVVGGEAALGLGFVTAARCLAKGRLNISSVCVGKAQRLVHETVEYAKTREQGGRPIGRFQLVQGLVADSVTDLYAGRALLRESVRTFADGSDTVTGPAAVKYFCSEMVGRVADRAVQVHGGAGYMRGTPVERFYRDVRVTRIYEGTTQIQQVIIARRALGDAARS